MSTEAPLLEVSELTVDYRRRGRDTQRALDRVRLTIATGETLALVGESGSGKSTLGNAILGLVPVTSGTLCFAGEDITAADARQRRRLSASLQAVFQDPYGSLNPSRSIGQTLIEPMIAERGLTRAAMAERVRVMLERVGLDADAANRYPADFSGGQRQRIAIARALMRSPRLVVCDEPVSALDLSVQAQVLNLLADLQTEMGLSYLFISHDLGVVRHVAHRVAVLYRGRIVETGPTQQIYESPVDPYTRALLAAVPDPDPRVQRRRRAPTGEGTPPDDGPDHRSHRLHHATHPGP
jgi:ABC-type oligopeptide transport system ATPase subunit